MCTHTDGFAIGSRMNLRALTLGLALLATAGGALAQEPATQPASPMRATVQPVAQALAEQIVMPVGRGTLVDFNEPIKRATVTDPTVAEVSILSPRQVMVSAKAMGTSQVILWDKDERQLALEVVVEMDLTAIKQAISRAAPGSNIEARAVRDAVVLNGTVADVDTADHVLEIARIMSPNVRSQIRVAGEQQVLLRCTVAEVDRNSTRELGINGWLAGDNVRDMFLVNQLDGINPVNIGAGRDQNILTPNGMAFGTDRSEGLPLRSRPSLSLGFPRVQMQLFIAAMRENGLVRVLAEPNLVALNGQDAKFLVGGEIPYPVPAATGTPGIEFREFGIQLKFLPVVIGRQMIRLTVAPTISEPDLSLAVNGVPGLRSRSASTTIELASGSTIAIAGLLNEQVRGAARKIPGVGDVPVLGALFSSVEYQRNTTELVILVTPELVSSMQPDQVALVPGDRMTGPNDFELFGLGLVEGKPAPDDSTPDEALLTRPGVKMRKYSSPPDQMSMHGPWGHAEAHEAVQ